MLWLLHSPLYLSFSDSWTWVFATTAKEERTHILDQRGGNVSVKQICQRTGNHFSHACCRALSCYQQCSCVWRPIKTIAKICSLIKREVLRNPFITSTTLKKLYSYLQAPKDVSHRTVSDRLKKELCIPAHRAMQKPVLTAHLKQIHTRFSKKLWNLDWRKRVHCTVSKWKHLFICLSDKASWRVSSTQIQ